MIRTLIGLTLACVLTWSSNAQNFKEQLTIPLSKPNERGVIRLDHLNGDITVTGYSGKEVIITATTVGESFLNHGTSENQAPAGMKRVDANSVGLTARETNNSIRIEAESWKQKMNLEMKVPVNADLDLSTVHGKIILQNVNGAMDLSSVEGIIDASAISGSVLANTVNGNIKITFKAVTSNEPMSFVTLNGDIDVTLPAQTKATTKIRSDRGEVYTDFDMEMQRSIENVRKESGTYEVSLNSWVYGKINGGGPEYTFKNMHGSIIVRKGS